jgi:inner membrane protein
MDSLTHAALGAAVAEAAMGRQLGRRAALWGAAIGTLPDLDIIAFPWMDALQRLEWHRGPSHALPFILAASPLLGWMIAHIHSGKIHFARAAAAVACILASHVLIDVFTVYGTAILAPFSDLRAGTNNFFIIDPLFTTTILAGLAIALFAKNRAHLRRAANCTGLALATLYVLWSFAAKSTADAAFEKSLRANATPAIRHMSAPTPFNTLLWRCVAETPDSFLVGYHSLLAPSRPIEFLAIPKNPLPATNPPLSRTVEKLLWFSNGYLTIEPLPDGFLASDWRFAEFRATPDSTPAALFSWKIFPDGTITPLRARFDAATHLRRLLSALR